MRPAPPSRALPANRDVVLPGGIEVRARVLHGGEGHVHDLRRVRGDVDVRAVAPVERHARERAARVDVAIPVDARPYN